MKRLMQCVDGIVRPLHATERRKLRMREELLAHLAELCEEVRGEADAGSDAEEGAIARFGEPGEVRAALQASVPAAERALFQHVAGLTRLEGWMRRRFDRAQDEPIALWALRGAIFTGALVFVAAIFCAPLVGVVYRSVSHHSGHGPVYGLALGGVMSVMMPWITFSLLATAGMMAEALALGDGLRTGLRVAGMAVGLALVTAGAAIAFTVLARMAGLDFSRTGTLRFMTGMGLLMPALCVITAAGLATEWRRERFWRGFAGDEES